MEVIGIAALPGSGKSGLMDELRKQGYCCHDDVNRDWNGNLPRVKSDIRSGQKVAISDIMFCDESWRRRLESELGVSVQWIFFENNPWQCAKNSLYRFMYEKPHRPLQEEVRKIGELSRIFNPSGDVRPVVQADTRIQPTLTGPA